MYDQCGAAIAEEGEGDARSGQKSGDNADVEEYLNGEQGNDTHHHQGAKPVTGVERDPVAAEDEQGESSDYKCVLCEQLKKKPNP